MTLVTTDGRSSAFSDPVDLLIQPSTRSLPDSSLVARKLVDSHYLLVASPALLDALPRLSVPQDLSACPVIGWTFSTPLSRWLLAHPEQGAAEVVVEPRFNTDNLMLVRDATVANLIFERSEPLVDIELQARVFLDPAVVARKR